MVRNPLARRVPGDERLNSVDCILPFFDRTTAGNVVKFLTGAIDELPGGAGKKVLLDGRELAPNPEIPAEVWAAWDALPTETVPQRGARPVKRLVSLALALSADGVRPERSPRSRRTMHTVLDALAVRYKDELEQAMEEIWAVRGMTISGRRQDRQADVHRVRRARRRPRDPRRLRRREEGVRRRRRPVLRQPPRQRGR